MKRYWLASGIALTLALGLIPLAPVEKAHSQAAVMCVNCANAGTQLLERATQVQQLASQARSLQTQISQFQNMVMNSKTLSSQTWNNAMQDFQQLNSIMSQSKALGFSAKNIAGQFASQYGTFASYKNQNMSYSGWLNKLAQWSQQNSDNAKYTLQGLGVQASQMQNEQAAIRQIQAMANSSQGQMQALQVANQMAGQNVDQIMKLRELIMMEVQMQGNYLAQQQDKEAAQQAARQKYYQVIKSDWDGQGF
jgi:P-type conjugative transfer protein TrbJ